MPAGQPTDLTPDLIRQFAELLPVVLYMESVAAFLGVERSTWRRWITRGKAESKRLQELGARPRQKEALYLEFFNTHKRAIAEGEIGDAGAIREAALAETRPVKVKRVEKPDGSVEETTEYMKPEWTAAAWRLERRFPERWGSEKRTIAALERQVKELEKHVGGGATPGTPDQASGTAASPAEAAPGPLPGVPPEPGRLPPG
jgi:hypothetical protein